VADRLILVRHGETVGKSSIRYFGRTDLPLSDVGRDQMRAAANWIASHLRTSRFAPIFSSPLSRAMEGARLIAGTDAPVIQIEEFVEVDFGLFEGLTAEEIREQYPSEFETWNRDRLDPAFAYPGGESRAGFVARVGRGVQRMLEIVDAAPTVADRTGATLLVAHRGVIRTIIQELCGVAPSIELGSIHILRRANENPQWLAEKTDVVEHLKAIG
jgi:broad specificity phosphatase PhoE